MHDNRKLDPPQSARICAYIAFQMMGPLAAQHLRPSSLLTLWVLTSAVGCYLPCLHHSDLIVCGAERVKREESVVTEEEEMEVDDGGVDSAWCGDETKKGQKDEEEQEMEVDAGWTSDQVDRVLCEERRAEDRGSESREGADSRKGAVVGAVDEEQEAIVVDVEMEDAEQSSEGKAVSQEQTIDTIGREETTERGETSDGEKKDVEAAVGTGEEKGDKEQSTKVSREYREDAIATMDRGEERVANEAGNGAEELKEEEEETLNEQQPELSAQTPGFQAQAQISGG